MSEEAKKLEKIEQDAKQEVKPAELSEQELDNVAGGKTQINGSRSNIKTNVA